MFTRARLTLYRAPWRMWSFRGKSLNKLLSPLLKYDSTWPGGNENARREQGPAIDSGQKLFFFFFFSFFLLNFIPYCLISLSFLPTSLRSPEVLREVLRFTYFYTYYYQSSRENFDMNVHQNKFKKDGQIIFPCYGPNPDGLQLSITAFREQRSVIFGGLIKV